MSGDLLRQEGPDEEGLHEGGGRHVRLPQHLHGQDQAVVVVPVRVSQPQSPVSDSCRHLLRVCVTLHHRLGGQHPLGGQP